MIPEIWSRIDILSFSAIVCSFTPITQKIKNLKKWKKNKKKKNTWSYHHFTSLPKIICYVPKIWCMADVIVSFWAIFCPFTPLTAKKIKLFKNKKSTWRYHHFTQVYQKPWLNAILFLRWSTWGMLLLYFILGYFLPFHPTTEISFCTSAPKIMICYTVPEGDPPPTNWRIGLSQYH